MNQTLNIENLNLIIGYFLLLIPFGILYYYKTGLVKSSFIAIARMTIQLLLIGLYLEYLFRLNSFLVNFSWAILMIIIASFSVISRSNLKVKTFLLPVFISLLISLVIIDSYFLGIVIKLEYFFDARYFIPITGMLLGNCLQTNIIALNSFYKKLNSDKKIYKFYLANGSSKKDALEPFLKIALQDSFNPMIANIAVIGLISLPGMMTGQILGGSSPSLAIKYQIMLMITIFASSVISVALSIIISSKFAFDKYDNYKFKN